MKRKSIYDKQDISPFELAMSLFILSAVVSVIVGAVLALS
jgi:hypothetical protein